MRAHLVTIGLVGLGAMLHAACAASTVYSPEGGGAGGLGGTGGIGPLGGNGGYDPCDCLPGPHNDLIYTLSDTAEIWSYDPAANSFAYVRSLLCPNMEQPFSMAIDHRGNAWVLSADSNLVFTLSLSANQGCDNSPYTPYQADFDLFGMSFASSGTQGECPLLYVHSYSGTGPFSEGPNAGVLAVVDPDSGELTELGSVDYDGGEMAGTGHGRLYAFAGVGPAKLVEYDRQSGATLQTFPLEGLSKTNASAFAFFAGDAYFFTEALPAGCWPCLEQHCSVQLHECMDDPICTEHLQCVLDHGSFSDECGGMLPTEVQTCLVDCGNLCLVPSYAKVSKVTRLDFDDSEGNGPILEEVLAEAPIRVVGAADSVCVPPIAR